MLCSVRWMRCRKHRAKDIQAEEWCVQKPWGRKDSTYLRKRKKPLGRGVGKEPEKLLDGAGPEQVHFHMPEKGVCT